MTRWPEVRSWQWHCQRHPDHNGGGLITNAMIQQRMQEEIDELRRELTKARRLAGRGSND